jgi:hypothetical protein
VPQALQNIKILKETKNMSNAVDFSNPEALEAELAAIATTDATPKTKKEAKPRIIKVSFTAQEDILAGETVTFDYEVPKSAGTHGIVSGVALEDMTVDQLKIEYRNANSVWYKTKKAGKDFSKAEARLNACKAEMEKKGVQPSSRSSVAIDAASIANLIKSGAINLDDLQALLDA